MSRLHRTLEDRINLDFEHASNILAGAADILNAAENLELRLREAGFAARARGHLDEQGCVALVFTQAPSVQVLRWLAAHAIHHVPVSAVDTADLTVRTYSVRVHGQELSLAICEARQKEVA